MADTGYVIHVHDVEATLTTDELEKAVTAQVYGEDLDPEIEQHYIDARLNTCVSTMRKLAIARRHFPIELSETDATLVTRYYNSRVQADSLGAHVRPDPAVAKAMAFANKSGAFSAVSIRRSANRRNYAVIGIIYDDGQEHHFLIAQWGDKRPSTAELRHYYGPKHFVLDSNAGVTLFVSLFFGTLVAMMGFGIHGASGLLVSTTLLALLAAIVGLNAKKCFTYSAAYTAGAVASVHLGLWVILSMFGF